MGENTVVKEQLSTEMIDAGAQLISKLDAMALPIAAALWLFDPEINEWRLLIASPDYPVRGPQDIYGSIQEARFAMGDQAAAVPMSLIYLVDPNQELVRLVRKGLPTGEGVSRVRFSKNVISGHFIEDALIYRAA